MLLDGCDDSCGWTAAIVSAIAYGTYGVPVKESFKRRRRQSSKRESVPLADESIIFLSNGCVKENVDDAEVFTEGDSNGTKIDCIENLVGLNGRVKDNHHTNVKGRVITTAYEENESTKQKRSCGATNFVYDRLSSVEKDDDTDKENYENNDKDHNVNPLVFQSYKTFVMFCTCWFVLLLGVKVRFTPWGLLSGFLWVVGGTSGVVAVENAGMATAVGTWASVMICVNFVWGILIFHEPVHNIATTIFAFGLLTIGLIGMSIFSSPSIPSTIRTPITTPEPNALSFQPVLEAIELPLTDLVHSSQNVNISTAKRTDDASSINHFNFECKSSPRTLNRTGSFPRLRMKRWDGATADDQCQITFPTKVTSLSHSNTSSTELELVTYARESSNGTNSTISVSSTKTNEISDHSSDGSENHDKNHHDSGDSEEYRALLLLDSKRNQHNRHSQLTGQDLQPLLNSESVRHQFGCYNCCLSRINLNWKAACVAAGKWEKRTIGIIYATVNGVMTGSSLIPMHYAKKRGFGGANYMISYASGAMICNLTLWLMYFTVLLIYHSYHLYRLRLSYQHGCLKSTIPQPLSFLERTQNKNPTSKEEVLTHAPSETPLHLACSTCKVKDSSWQTSMKRVIAVIWTRSVAGMPSFQLERLWLPGIVAGLFLTVAMFGSILAVTYLGQGIGNSVIQSKILISGMWGIFWYKEINQRRAIMMWFMSAFCTVVGIVWLSQQRLSATTVATSAAILINRSSTSTEPNHRLLFEDTAPGVEELIGILYAF